ncbi:MAG: MFS transporter [Chromatiaceae bacterium]|nr:MFS transporter [Chromatiaceae bacterium]
MNTPAFDQARFNRVRWTVFWTLIASYIMVFFHRMVPGVVAADLMQAFQTSGAALGSLAATYFYIYTALQIPSGVLADTLGPRISVTLGGLVSGAGSILFGLAPDFGTASWGRFLVGLGVSVVFIGLMKTNAVWFSERQYGRIGGLTLLLGNLGSIMAAGPLALLLVEVSWRSVFVSAGFVSIAFAVLTLILVRNRPEDAGFPSLREQEGLPSHPARDQHWLRDLREVMTTRAVWPGFWVNFGLTGCFLAFAGLWAVPLMRDLHGLDRAGASLYTTVTLAAFAIGAFKVGWISDRIGRRRPVIIAGTALSCLAWLAMILLPWGPGWSGLLIFTVLGLTAGGNVVVYAAAKEVLPARVAGMAIALVNTGLFLGAAVMQPAFGWVLDLTWDGALREGVRLYGRADYLNGLWLSFGCALIALVAAPRMRETRCQQQG